MLSIILSLALAVPSLADSITRGEDFLWAPVTARRNASALRLGRRQVVGALASLPDTSYTIDLDIGTPPQKITVVIDTGSSDLWVNPVCGSAGPKARMDECSKLPQFDYTKSSTLKDQHVSNRLSYAIGEALVQYVSDKVAIGSTSISDQIFGIAFESSDLGVGFLGLSPPPSSSGQYRYVLDSLANQKSIASRAFSLDLKVSDKDGGGSLIFGGVDTKKFSGALEKCPILGPEDAPAGGFGYSIHLTEIGITTPDGVSHTSPITPVGMVFDTGSTVNYLPRAVFLALGELFPGAKYDPVSRFFVVDCPADGSTGTVDFTFQKKVIRVPYSDLVFKSGDQCSLIIIEATDGLNVLGDTFLRNAYVVFDEDNRNLHLAQAANCGSNVIAIGSGPDAVPSSTGECTEPTPTPTKSTVSLDVSGTDTPTALYSGSPVSTPLANPGPQLSTASIAGSALASPTRSSSAEPTKVARNSLSAAILVMLSAWGL